MPPHIPRKRRSPEPSQDEPPKKKPAATKAQPKSTRATKKTLFQAQDASPNSGSVADAKTYLKQAAQEDDSESESSASDDKPSATKKRKVNGSKSTGKTVPYAKSDSDSDDDSSDDEKSGSSSDDSESDDSSSEDETAWDQILGAAPDQKKTKDQGDIDITIDDIPSAEQIAQRVDTKSKKYAPSKREKAIRTATHVMHVQCLTYHNFLRNRWCENPKLQEILIDGLSPGCIEEIELWRKACGSLLPEKAKAKNEEARASPQPEKKKKGKPAKNGAKNKSAGRDWSAKAKPSEEGNPNFSHGDPTLRMLKVLSTYWKKKFSIIAPGQRKQGYKHIRRLAKEFREFKNGETDVKFHGEKIANFDEFCNAARACKGSRDVGAQLFTALLRGIGLECRLVSNLQTLGYGWTKAEEADPPKPTTEKVSKEETTPTKSAKATNGRSNKKLQETQQKKTPARASKSKATGADSKNAIALSDSESALSTPPPSEDESVVDVTPAKAIPQSRVYDRDLAFPVYWTEVFSPVKKNWLAIDPLVLSVIASNPDAFSIFEPSGARASKTRQTIGYVLAHASDHTVKDVTVRYLKKHVWPGKTKGVRMAAEKIPIYNNQGKVRRYEMHDWFKHMLTLYMRPIKERTESDEVEDNGDLKPLEPSKDTKGEAKGDSLQWYKQSAEFVLERHLRREEAILPGSKPVRQFTTGKGDNTKSEPVFRRVDVVACRTVESWHKEGREVLEGEEPLKWVPMRAVTAARKQQIAMAERDMGGEKLQQGLYAEHQTDWIIPPPIQNGVIPKNAYGNMDCFVPTMVPEGAVHIPRRGTAKVCKRLEIDFAEACTGFEFGNRMAVPVLTGVVVAREHEKLVMDAWREDQAEQKRKEEAKLEKQAIVWWKKMLAGLRVLEKMRTEYGHGAGELSSVQQSIRNATQNEEKGKRAKKAEAEDVAAYVRDRSVKKAAKQGAGSGGFVRDDADEDEDALLDSVHDGGGFVRDEDETMHDPSDLGGGGFLLDEDEAPGSQKPAANAPRSLAALMRKRSSADDGPAAEEIDNLDAVHDESMHESKPEPESGLAPEPDSAATEKTISRRKPARKAHSKAPGAEDRLAFDEAEESLPLKRKPARRGRKPKSEDKEAQSEKDSEGAKKRSRRGRPSTSKMEVAKGRLKRQGGNEDGDEDEGEGHTTRRRSGRRAVVSATGSKSKYFEGSDSAVGDEDEDAADD